MSTIALIAAVAKNGVIGIDNRLPWHLSTDLKYFKATTLDHTILMGRKTFDSLGRPLPKRRNIVMTQNKSWQQEGCEVVHSIDEVLAKTSTEEKVFVIGGEAIFAAFLPRADYLYLTEIHQDFEGDTFFPHYEKTQWQEIQRLPHVEDEVRFDFVVYKRV